MKAVYGFLILFFFTLPGFTQVEMQKAEEGFLFTENNNNVLFYQVKPKNKDGQFERCNYIHPLWTPGGTIITKDFPADHLHHRGVFWAWHQIWIGDQRIGDGWELKDFEQEIAEIEFISDKSGAAKLKTEVLWKSNKWKTLGEKVPFLRENTSIIIHPEKNNARKIDFEIRLIALVENLKIGGSEDEKGYSGFSARMVLPEDVIFSGPTGKIIPENTQVESEGYVNVFGSFENTGEKGGTVIIDNPENPGFPQKWILREKNSMQNIVFPGEKTVQVSTTEPIVLKYSLLVYSGKMTSSKIQKLLR